MLLGYWDVLIHALQETWWHPAHLHHSIRHRAEIFKPEEAGTVKCTWLSPAGWGSKGCCCVVTALHPLRLVFPQSWSMHSQLQSLCWTVEMCSKVSVMPSCHSMFQGCSCLIVSVYESYADISASPLGSLRTLTVNPAEMAPSPTSTVDNSTLPARDRWKRNNPLEWGQNSTSSNVKGKAEENSKQTGIAFTDSICRSWHSNR